MFAAALPSNSVARVGLLWQGGAVDSKRDSGSDHPAGARSKRRVRSYAGGIIVPQALPKKRAIGGSALERQLEALRTAASQQESESKRK